LGAERVVTGRRRKIGRLIGFNAGAL
jgi:hypothetical protein